MTEARDLDCIPIGNNAVDLGWVDEDRPDDTAERARLRVVLSAAVSA